MVNSWDFILKSDKNSVMAIRECLVSVKPHVIFMIHAAKSEELYRLICDTVIEDNAVMTYFDFIAYFCDKYKAPLRNTVQATEDGLLMNIFGNVINKYDDITCMGVARALDINCKDRKELISLIRLRQNSSRDFKNELADTILKLSNDPTVRLKLTPVQKLLVTLVKVRWDVMRPMTQDKACSYVLDYIKTSRSYLPDSDYSCLVMARIIEESKGNLPDNIIEKLEVISSHLDDVLSGPMMEKLIPHSDALVEMLMRRICQTDERQIEMLSKANDLCQVDKKVLFAEYAFPYTKVNKNWQYLGGQKYDIANMLYLYYKEGESFSKMYVSAPKGKYSHILCLAKNEDVYAPFGPLIILDRMANPYLQYENVSKAMLPFFEMSIAELRRESVKTQDAKEFDKLLSSLIRMKEQVSYYKDTMARLRHDYSARLGVIGDYIQYFSTAEQNEKDVALQSYNAISSAIGGIGKEIRLSPCDLNDVLNNAISSDSFNNKDYKIVFEGLDCSADSLINEEAFCTSVLGNIFANAHRHGFVLERPTEQNIIHIQLLDEGNAWRIIIKNNGKSFLGDVEKVFVQGYIAGPTGHTGEGMSSAYEIVTEMKGDMSFDSFPEAEYPVVITINLPKYNEKKM